LGTLNFHRPTSLPHPSLGEFVREEASAGGADTGEDGEGARPTGAGANRTRTTPVRGKPAQVEAAAADVLLCAYGIRLNKVEPLLEDASSVDVSHPRFPRGPGSCLPRDVTPGVAIPAPGSSDILDLGGHCVGAARSP
jgi:hypothetical protein